MNNNAVNGPEDHVAYRMETSRDLLDWLGGEFARRALARDEGGKIVTGAAGAAGTGPEAGTMAGLETQVARVCELVNLAVSQVDLYGDLGMAWILLEQARQQLGHAAVYAAVYAAEAGRNGGGGAVEVAGHAAVRAQIVCLLQLDLMPWPQDAAGRVDFGGGPGLVPDFLPDSPLELLPLQVLAHTTMTLSAGGGTGDVGDGVMGMAFGEYVATILVESMELLEHCADRVAVDEIVDTGYQVAHLVSGAFPPPFQIFQGPAGFPDTAA